MHHYPFHPSDYLMQTAHLDPMEDLAYRRLLDMYYSNEAPIPTETDLVSRRLRIGSEVVSKVLNEFFDLRDDGWHNNRCDEEIIQYHAKQERARFNGKQGGRPKKSESKPKKTKPVILANQEETGLKANQNQNQEINKPPIPPSGFDVFWKIYPKREGKAQAEKAWKKANINGNVSSVIDALEKQIQAKNWHLDKTYCPLPATWINGRRWEDELQGSSASGMPNLFAGAI